MLRNAIIMAAVAAAVIAATAYANGAAPSPKARAAATKDAFGNAAFSSAPGPNGVPGLAYSVARCPRGVHAISGGWSGDDSTGDPISISSSVATRGRRGWVVFAEDTSTDPTSIGYTFRAYVLCG